MGPGSSKATAQMKRGEAQKKARKAQMKKQKLQQEDDYDSAEKGTTASLTELQGDAIGYLQTGQLNVCRNPFLPLNPAYLG
jgi:hypothetical protein